MMSLTDKLPSPSSHPDNGRGGCLRQEDHAGAPIFWPNFNIFKGSSQARVTSVKSLSSVTSPREDCKEEDEEFVFSLQKLSCAITDVSLVYEDGKYLQRRKR